MDQTFFRKHRVLFSTLLAAFVLLAALFLSFSSSSPARLVRRFVKYQLLHRPTATQALETADLPEGWSSQLYLDGLPAALFRFNENRDNKRVYTADDVTRLVNYPNGYQLDLPGAPELDFSRSSAVVTAQAERYACTVSLEYCPYTDPNDEMGGGLASIAPWYEWETAMDQYIGYYQCRFLWSEAWQENNRVAVTRPEPIQAGSYSGMIFHATVSDMPQDRFDAYSYVYIPLEGQDFLRAVYKYRSEDTAFRDTLPSLLSTFRTFQRVGVTTLQTDFHPELPTFWSQETRTLYDAITQSQDLCWGIYTDHIYDTGIQETVPQLEETLDYTFGAILSYLQYGQDFPTDFMEENRAAGRIVELTYQFTANNNEDMFGYSPLLDIYRGKGLELLRTFARQARDYGHPFLFRLCNEMNSDWTSYGGVVNLADPDVFISVYRTVYDIFREEGVDNCIWIYNPNDRNAPPNSWNDAINYYPGNEYVQMIGVTGYNNGTYYTQWAEEWREFDVIYDHIQWLYGDVFGDFPWIITEFSSSSIGGDKVAWIDNMFATIGNYPNIKIAVWFSFADWDAAGNVARPYWLDETPETTEAFRRGLKNYPTAAWPLG